MLGGGVGEVYTCSSDIKSRLCMACYVHVWLLRALTKSRTKCVCGNGDE